jgi:uncharacterized membrane protein YeaQ/YmgE (transglycosylase-associated protein family)
MSLAVWLMMGIAVWHFTVFVPDRFWGGIVGAFLVATVGAVLFGFLVNGLTVPGRNDTEFIQALVAIPGALVALAASYLWGSRLDVAHGVDHGHTREGSV